MNNLISVIIPIYNVEDYLEKCIDNIIGQTYANLEIILVDDGSPDRCGNMCDEYASRDSRIKVIHKVNGGVSSARNAGLDIATGDWIYFIDPDDWIDLDTLELVLDKALKTNTDMCLFDHEQIFKNQSFRWSAVPSDQEVFFILDDLKTLFLYCHSHVCWNFIFKAELVSENIRFNEAIYMNEDLAFKFELYEYIKSFSYLPKALYHNILRSDSATANIRPSFIQNERLLYNHMISTIESGNYPDFAERIPNTILISGLGNVVRLAFKNNTSLKCDYEIINTYRNTIEYENAIKNYDECYIRSRIRKLYIKCTNKYQFTLVYILEKAREFYMGKRRWKA